MKNIPVREFMDRKPESVGPGMPLTELVDRLRQGRHRSLPVVDDGAVVGVVSETDLFLKELPVPFSTEKVPSLLGKMISTEQIDAVERCRKMSVGEVMSPSVVATTEETRLEELAQLMFERRLSMVPVVRDGKLVGVARRSDILAVLYGAAA